MREVIVGGLFTLAVALISAVLVDGGLKARTRRRIREELELAALLGVETSEGGDLQRSARRLAFRYVTPFSVRFVTTARARLLTSALALMAITLGFMPLVPELLSKKITTDPAETLALLSVVGAFLGLVVVVGEVGLVWLYEVLVLGFRSIWHRLKHGRRRPVG